MMVAKQPIKLGPRHAGKLVTVVIEDTHFRILHGDEEVAVKPRRNPGPITRLHVRGKGAQRGLPAGDRCVPFIGIYETPRRGCSCR